MSSYFVDMDDAIMATKIFYSDLMNLAKEDMKCYNKFSKDKLISEIRRYRRKILQKEYEMKNADITNHAEFPILVKELRLIRAQCKVLRDKRRMLDLTTPNSGIVNVMKRRYNSNI
jgi:hypothetical protein